MTNENDKKEKLQEQLSSITLQFENQQQEFIEWLENEINEINEQIKNYDIWHEAGTVINFLILKKQFNIEILSKYKEIIGKNIDVNTKETPA